MNLTKCGKPVWNFLKKYKLLDEEEIKLYE